MKNLCGLFWNISGKRTELFHHCCLRWWHLCSLWHVNVPWGCHNVVKYCLLSGLLNICQNKEIKCEAARTFILKIILKKIIKTGFQEIKIGGIWAFCFNTAWQASLLLLLILNVSSLSLEHKSYGLLRWGLLFVFQIIILAIFVCFHPFLVVDQ